MNKTKKLTVSAIAVALGAVFSAVGAYFEIADLSAAALASLLVMFIYIEVGSPYTWLVWLSTTLVSFIIAPGGTVWLAYLTVFGLYPILKAYIERVPRILWLVLKLLFCNAALLLMLLGCEFILGVPFFSEEDIFGLSPTVIRCAVWVLLDLAFLLYDYFITVMARFYLTRMRSKFEKYLK